MHRHFLVLVGNLTDADNVQAPLLMAEVARDWFNYTPNAWIICTAQTSQQLHQALQGLLSMPAYFLIVDISNVTQAASGMMPPEAWIWLKRHGLVGS